MTSSQVTNINTTPDEFVKLKKRDILKAVKNVPKYTRASAAAKVAAIETDQAMELNRVDIPACAKGCAFCCHIQTDIHAGEAFVLAAAVRRMPPDQREDVMTRLRANADTFSRMSLTERQRANIPCALLDLETQSCSVYDDRPSACHRWHSLDASRCETEFHNPGTVGTPTDPVSYMVGVLIASAYIEAMKEPGGELHQGVLMAIEPDAEKRFAKGEAVFQGWTMSDANATPEERETMIRQGGLVHDAALDLMAP